MSLRSYSRHKPGMTAERQRANSASHPFELRARAIHGHEAKKVVDAAIVRNPR